MSGGESGGVKNYRSIDREYEHEHRPRLQAWEDMKDGGGDGGLRRAVVL